MAVYKRGYQRYTGARTSRWTRFLALPRFAWSRLFDQKLVIIILMASMFWPLACAGFIYVANHSELWQGFGREFAKNFEIGGTFFLIFMNTQATVAVILAASVWGAAIVGFGLAHQLWLAMLFLALAGAAGVRGSLRESRKEIAEQIAVGAHQRHPRLEQAIGRIVLHFLHHPLLQGVHHGLLHRLYVGQTEELPRLQGRAIDIDRHLHAPVPLRSTGEASQPSRLRR